MVWPFASSSSSSEPTRPDRADARRRSGDGASARRRDSSDAYARRASAAPRGDRPSRERRSGAPRPSVPALHVSEENAECPVCFEPLCAAPTAVFVSRAGGRRTCAHFFHLSCANDLARHLHLECPICRVPFAAVKPVPNPRDDPNAWFAAVDANGDGKLSPAEVLEVLRAQLPCDWRAIERELRADLFRRWDPDGDGFIERREMTMPGGLLDFVTTNFPRRASMDVARDRKPPSLAAAPDEWFRFWDEDRSGTLDKDEVTRALIKTFGLSEDLRQVRDMRGVVEAVFGLFDPDGSGSIDRREFLMRDGLAETIVASAGVR